MFKKIVIILVVLAVGLVFLANFISRKGPDFLVEAIEKALNKKVIIRSVEYHFPFTFELAGFEIREKGRFEGETSFYVDQIALRVSPLSLSQRKLILDRVDVEKATIIIRKYDGKLTHSLSDAIRKNQETASGQIQEKQAGGRAVSAPGLPLAIGRFELKNSQFQLIDYDAQADGFVVTLDHISGEVDRIALPFSPRRTTYKINAQLPQGRDQEPGKIGLSGWTVFSTMDTDANIGIQNIFLPYFRPYYGQVTSAAIERGYLNARANVRVDKKELVLNADLEIIELLFQSYELGDQLFGLRAMEILSFLKDRSGRLKFQFTARWDLNDPSVRARDVIRKSIERSLKNTILGNVTNILDNTLQKVGEQGFEKTKEEIEGTLEKIKDLFKY
jgi:hypothetical protein